MDFRRSGLRDERRRRVLRDDEDLEVSSQSANESSDSEESHATAAGRNYSEAALAENQVHLTDLIPTRRWAQLVLFLSALTLIAGVQCLYIVFFQAPLHFASFDLRGFDVAAAGSLASWLSAMLLGYASLIGILIYCLRRHKLDDYRGRYRIWPWFSALLMLASIDCVAGLHNAIATLIAQHGGGSLAENDAAWWIIVFAIVFGATMLRACFEIRASAGAITSLALGAVCYVIAAGMTIGSLSIEIAFLHESLRSTTILLAHLFIATAVFVFARHVYLDAQGQLVQKQSKPKHRRKKEKQKKKRAVPSEELPRKNEPATENKQLAEPPVGKNPKRGPLRKRRRPEKVDTPAAEQQPVDQEPETEESIDFAEVADSAPRKLTKAERRRLRKLKRKQQQDRAA